MNGLLVTLPFLLLLFSSLYTSHAPILVLEERARAIRVSLHSWVLNYSRARDPQKPPPARLFSARELDHCGGWGRDSPAGRLHHGIICLIYRLGSTEPSCLGKPKLPECNAASPVWECRTRAGEYWAVCDRLAHTDNSVWSMRAKCWPHWREGTGVSWRGKMPLCHYWNHCCENSNKHTSCPMKCGQ